MIPYCILAIEDDDDRAFMADLYLQYRNLMFHTVNGIIGDPWLADDAVQTALERLIDKIIVLRSFDKKRLANYILTTCKNIAYNICRYQHRHNALSFDEYIDSIDSYSSAPSTEDYIILNEEIATLRDVWGQLDEKTQYLLEAKYILGKQSLEIAKDLNIQPASVRMALTRARNKVYSLIADNNRDSG